jgi:hypothetical protein
MSRLNSVIFASITAGLLAFAGTASAAPTGLSGAKFHAAPSTELVRYHGGFGGFHGFYGGRHFYGGGHRYYGGWGYGFRPHYYRHRYYAYPLVIYGGYPYYDDYYDDYGYYDVDACYYSRRYRARICPDD